MFICLKHGAGGKVPGGNIIMHYPPERALCYRNPEPLLYCAGNGSKTETLGH